MNGKKGIVAKWQLVKECKDSSRWPGLINSYHVIIKYFSGHEMPFFYAVEISSRMLASSCKKLLSKWQ